MALQMGTFLLRTSLALARGNNLEHFGSLRRNARLTGRFGRLEAERIVRISYIYNRYFEARNTRYVRAMLLHHFADSKALDGSLFQALEQMTANVLRRGGRGAVLLIDIDRFGSITDSLGNAAADRMLATIESIIERALVESGIGGRFGGDEFLVLVSDTSDDATMQMAERIRAAVGGAGLTDGQGKPVTVSAGVIFASYGSNAVDLVEYADRALRLAKHGGRNCVVASPPIPAGAVRAT